MRAAEPFENFEALVVREQDDGMGMALPFAFSAVRDTGNSTAGGDPICAFGDAGHVVVKYHDETYGWVAVARDIDRFEQLEQLELDAADRGIDPGLGTVCHQARFETPGGPPSEHAAAWNQAVRNRTLEKYLLEPDQLAELDRLVAELRELGNTVSPMHRDHARLVVLRAYFLTDQERRDGPGLGANLGVRYLDRSIWLCDVLCHGIAGRPRLPGDDDADALIDLLDDPDRLALQPDALYWMWWSHFRGSDELTGAIISRCDRSDDPLIRSAVALLGDLRAGRDTIGSVTGLGELRSALRAL